ncbi:bifunctional riboflavin kinase/FAD synthetase [Alkalimonas delamerensis]|uniref:Riboflavin biosynthesis protein n=1 Tax=Alkalimonas delamerensis TaxID=265981 RepID=A0ABT9GRY7_9GAMM|nr:bifunctional riboflavin kinase/FAD synthetase [Alkalimonas delamerensis]MDP4529746.1 bifunctional riboflavin kinase/FAD synthetase [Alkalimonas delamerensis]
MEFIRGLHNIKAEHRGCVLTIGNFDGVHLGHQAVLHQLLTVAKDRQLPSCVMVFEPQPLELFAPDKAPARISRLREKYLELAKLGVDRLLCVNFNQRFADLAPDYFVEQLLLRQLGVQHLIVGDDFCFGKNRAGNFALLQQEAVRFKFGLTPTASLKQQTQRISSTAIRQALAADDLPLAHSMLGRPFSLTGKVRHGRRLGRQLGFPTANVWLYRKKLPVHGVYAIEADTVFGRFQGVANIGSRPTVSGKTEQLEAHLFDFEGDLYGSQIEVLLRHKLRDEQSFASVDALQQQIQRDAAAARHYFQSSASAQVATNQ